MPYRDVVSRTGMLSADAKSGCHDNVVELFGQMVVSGQYPNEFTLSSVLRSCSMVEDCDYVEEAQKLFAPMNIGDVFTWTTMISSLIQSQKYNEALYLYFDMIKAGVNLSEFTSVKLSGASSYYGLDHVNLVHARLIIWEIDLNAVLKTTLVDVYGKCQKMEDALKVVNQTDEYDVSLWTAIISDSLTVMLLGLEYNELVGNSLVDMYMKCSHVTEDAIRAFNGISSGLRTP
ncbi:Pentatricopeptide repeat [Dillenia turbinata]|uniref:Pentatricopeptide repeat n=1 Tax=Dillenia turbinata TaxID=194707 RepID=A0AAN8Z839_9MAGN